MAGLPFLEREVERSKPRVVCFQGLGIDAPVHVTTILSIFDKKMRYFSYIDITFIHKKFTNYKIIPPPPLPCGEGSEGDIIC